MFGARETTRNPARAIRITQAIAQVLGVLILTWACHAPVVAQGVTAAADLQGAARAAAGAGVPLVLFFSEPGCPYCMRARSDFLVPMLADPSTAARLRMLEVDISGAAMLTDFSGRRTSAAQFSRDQGVRFVPTLKFYDGHGAELAPPLVGLTLPEFYPLQIDRRLEQAAGRLRAR